MAKLYKKRTFDFDDVVLVPGKSIVSSRSEIDVSTQIGGRTFDLPVIPANMSTIVDENLAIQLAKKGYFYILHRFDVDTVAFLDLCEKEEVFSSISIGIKEEDNALLQELKEKNYSPDYITVDVAHGFSESVANSIRNIKKLFPKTFVIAGNVATKKAALFLEEAGADAVKVGIAPGAACTTGPNTGFGTINWQLSAVEEVAEVLTTALVIADGGIRSTGDIAKAVAFGADLVMIGGMLAGHKENPGEITTDEYGNKTKVFFGSASEFQKGHKRHVEGRKLVINYRGSIWDTLTTIKENLQSSISYAGGVQLSDLLFTEYVFKGERC